MRYLFERLCDPARAGAESDTRQAVREQLERLAWTYSGGADADANVVPFGLPSIVEPGPASAPGIAQYALAFKRLVERHEPRLREPSVALEPTGQVYQPYRLVVSGMLEEGGAPEALSFPLDLAGP